MANTILTPSSLPDEAIIINAHKAQMPALTVLSFLTAFFLQLFLLL